MSFNKGAGEEAAEIEAGANLAAIDEIKRQFDITKADVDPFITAGKTALPGVETGATLEGFGANIADILGSDVLKPLIEERTRAVQGQLSAGGLTRSGKAVEDIAGIPTDFAFQLEELLFGRKADVAGTGVASALDLGSLGASAASETGGLLSKTGKARSSGLLTTAQAEAEGFEQAAGTAATLLPIIFSDPKLKDNIEEIGHVHDLKLYQWDWIKSAKDTLVTLCPTIGFMADEVKEKYPQFVKKYCSWDVVQYKPLLELLETKNKEIMEALA